MRVIVSLHHRFHAARDGTVYSHSEIDYAFLSRYLEVFDEVVVCARVARIREADPSPHLVACSGDAVTFVDMPDFHGARGFLRTYFSLRSVAQRVVRRADACILRVPSYLGTMLWRILMRTGRPYGVEVLGDPWEAMSPGSHSSVLRPILRRTWKSAMIRQCRHACVSAYVTAQALQDRYPPGGWSTHYSDVRLPGEVIASEAAVRERIARIEVKARTGGPWRLCFAGSLWHLCKAPDVLIDAVAECLRNGMRLELVVCGDGLLRPEIEARTRQAGIAEHVQFLGQLPPGEPMYEQFDLADLFILPSRSEGLPRALIEAMARGAPCVGGSRGGFPELLDSRYRVDPIDAATLSRTITETLSDAAAMKEAVTRNVKKAAQYRAEILQERRVEAYAKLRSITQEWADKHGMGPP